MSTISTATPILHSVPKTVFKRCIRDELKGMGFDAFRISTEAFTLMQTATEDHIVNILHEANDHATGECKRKTVMLPDLTQAVRHYQSILHQTQPNADNILGISTDDYDDDDEVFVDNE